VLHHRIEILLCFPSRPFLKKAHSQTPPLYTPDEAPPDEAPPDEAPIPSPTAIPTPALIPAVSRQALTARTPPVSAINGNELRSLGVRYKLNVWRHAGVARSSGFK
jgi:hypothetical protein